MFNINDALKAWRQNMRKNKHLEDGYIHELESHLLDEYDRLKQIHADSETAFNEAVKNTGSNNEIEKEYVKSSSLTSLPQPWQSKSAYAYLIFNYIKIAYRSIFKNKAYSIINIAGLSVGLACAFLIVLWVQDELSFDKFHNDVERIHRVYSEYPESGEAWQTSYTPDRVRDVFVNEYPEVEKVTRAKYFPGTIKYGDKKFKDEEMAIVDTDFFEVFNFPLKSGNIKSLFSDPHSALITEKLAQKIFGNKSPVGERISFEDSEVIISGVLADHLSNTQFQFGFYVPYSYLESTRLIETGWIGGRAETYIKLKNGIDPVSFESRIANIGESKAPNCGYVFKMQPFENIHLYSLTGEEEGMYYVYIFSIIALFILGMACINFMNLSTARSSKRAKEVGLRKVIGANRWQIIKQFYGESLFMTFLAGILAAVIILLVLPSFNEITDKNITLSSAQYKYVLGFILLLVFTGIVAGSYPALLLSSFTPSRVLRREAEKGLKGKLFRRALVITQFSLAIGLVFSALIVHQQLTYLQTKSLGFDKDNIVYMDLSGVDFKKYRTIKNEIKSLTGVKDASLASDLPSSIYVGTSSIDWEGKDPSQITSFTFNSVDEDYLKTFGVELLEGSNFYGDMQTDMNRFIVNESAAKIIGGGSPVGKRFSMWNTSGEIVGVVKDFHCKPLNSEIEPILFTCFPAFYKYCLVKVEPYQVKKVVKEIENIWAANSGGVDFEFNFLDETLNERYADEKRIAELFEYFTALAIFISVLGLIGLVTFTTQQRVKEIGIRKVLGASLPSILKLISREFVLWIISANVIALPLAYYFMNKWLDEFAYRIEFDWKVFAVVGIGAVIVSLTVIIIQSLRTALKNPVEALKYE